MTEKGNEYKDFSLEELEGMLETLAKTKKDNGILMINEGNGFIPFEQSKTFDDYMKKNYN